MSTEIVSDEPESTATPQASPKRTGRPQWQPTAAEIKLVDTMAANGVPQEFIARCLKITVKTLKKHCRATMDHASARGVAFTFGKLFEAVKNGEAWAIAKKLSIEAGYKESTVVQNQTLGADGKPINPPTGNTYVIKGDELKTLTAEVQNEV